MSEQKQGTPLNSSAGQTTVSDDLRGPLTHELLEAASIDVTQYKTAELKKRFHELFGVVHLLPWAAGGLAGCIIVSLSFWGILFVPRAPAVITTLALIYMGLQGFYLGILAASLLVVARVFQKLTAIIDITIQTLREFFRDVRKAGAPEGRAELAGALIHGAVIPTVQSVITVKMGLLRAPIGFVLNRILGKTAKKLTSSIREKLDSDDKTESNSQMLSPEEKSALHSKELAASEDSHLDRLQERVEVIARRTRRATMIPAIIFFIFVTAVSSIPWLLVAIALY